MKARAWVVVVALVVTVVGPGRAGPAGGAPVAPAQAPAPVPAVEAVSPAVTSVRDGRPDLFTRSSGGDLLHQYRPAGGSWTRAVSLGGDLTSQPAAASWGTDRVDVVARGADNAAWHRWYAGNGWSGWTSLGGQLSSAPAVATWGPGRLDVFGRGTDGALWHKSYELGRGWSGWERLGGLGGLGLTSSPAAASWADGRIDVFAAGGGQVAHLWFRRGAGWSPWEGLGGAPASQPAVASTGPNQLDLLVRRADAALWQRRYALGAGWSAWASLGGSHTSGPGAHAVGDDVRAVARAPNAFLQESIRTSPGAAWSPWATIDPYQPFRHLGTWVDAFDYAALDPAVEVPAMRSRGVRVLYLSTARFDGASDFLDPVEAGRWLDLAHQNGIEVVGWYVPAYGDMARDVRRTVAIARFVSPGGQRFDAVGVDIERFDEVPREEFNRRLVTHLAQVRAQAPSVIGAIVPSPFTTDPGNNWEGFPWADVGRNSEVVLPMALWSFRSNPDGSAYSPDQVYGWVLDQLRRAVSLTGRRVSVEGGVDDVGAERTPVTADRVTRFVDALLDGGAIGGSHYDYRTTTPTFWPLLARLNP